MEVRAAWLPWVRELTDLLDGLGCMRHLPGPGSYSEQPARDMMIYRVVRIRWVELISKRNEA